MAWAPLQIARTLLRRINARRLWPFLVFTTTGALAITTWLGWPLLATTPYVRVPASSVAIYSRCTPERVELRTKTPFVALARAHLVIHDPVAKQVLARYEVERAAVRVDGMPVFSMSVPSEASAQLESAKANFYSDGLTAVALDFNRVPYVDIASISIQYPADRPGIGCLAEELSGSTLLERLDDKHARLMYFNLVQDKLSDIIFRANEVVGNVLLAALALMALWMLMALVGGLRGVFLISDNDLNAALRSNQRTKEDIVASYSRIYRGLVLGRVLGPALGFLLTVSSLVAGLHPSAAAVKDTFQFVTSLQLALVATFMGLLVRIVAEFALRYQREFSERQVAMAPSRP